MFSSCKRYRYRLWRDLPNGVTGRGLFITLNPLGASATLGDPAVRRCEGLARKYGWTRFDLVGLFSYRTDDPQRLSCGEICPLGPDHKEHFEAAVRDADLVVCDWGGSGLAAAVAGPTLALIRRLGHVPMRVSAAGKLEVAR